MGSWDVIRVDIDNNCDWSGPNVVAAAWEFV